MALKASTYIYLRKVNETLVPFSKQWDSSPSHFVITIDIAIWAKVIIQLWGGGGFLKSFQINHQRQIGFLNGIQMFSTEVEPSIQTKTAGWKYEFSVLTWSPHFKISIVHFIPSKVWKQYILQNTKWWIIKFSRNSIRKYFSQKFSICMWKWRLNLLQ